MKFDKLVTVIQSTSTQLFQGAVRAVNMHLTMRNWLVGCYIVEFEQNGDDRAEYGAKLLQSLSKKIKIKGLSETNLKVCRQFYLTYPLLLQVVLSKNENILPISIRQSLPDELKQPTHHLAICQTVSDELQNTSNQSVVISQSLPDEFRLEDYNYQFTLLKSTSFTHFVELLQVNDPIKRRFYELLILKTTPSVRELQRHIETLTFERVGLSSDTELAFEQLQQKITPEATVDIVKSHYFFEFLNINQPQLIEESDLEQALVQNLKEFIIELGNGFCFEARQKRVLIGDEYFFIDLVFYHRILKCHVLIDLKTEKANHEHIGQLKAYLQHYKKKISTPDDNPPVGILLVTDQNKTLMEYAIADADKEIFVSKYLLQLPKKELLCQFLDNELKRL